MKIRLVTQYLPNYAEVAAITDKAREAYCAHWRAAGRDYSHCPIVGSRYDNLGLPFQRIKLIRDMLDEPGAPDLIVWHGCDVVITNPNIPIEAFTETRHTKDYHFYITYDVHGLNSDSFIVRNTDWSRRWLDFIMSKEPQYRNDCWTEQRVMQNHWQEEAWMYRILTMPQGFFNSYIYSLYKPWPADTPGQFQRGDFCLHLPGLNKEQRLEILTSEWLKQVTVPWEAK